MICPQCRSVNTMVGADGGGLCFDCRFEWNPAELVAGPAPVILPFAMATVDDVFGPPRDLAVYDENPATGDIELIDMRTGESLEEPDPQAYPPSWEGLRQFRRDGGHMRDETWYRDVMGSPAPVIDEADEAPFEMDDLLGQVATLDGGQQVLIVGTDGFGPLTVITASGDELTVPLSDVTRVDPLPDLPEPVTDVHEGDQQEEAT